MQDKPTMKKTIFGIPLLWTALLMVAWLSLTACSDGDGTRSGSFQLHYSDGSSEFSVSNQQDQDQQSNKSAVQ